MSNVPFRNAGRMRRCWAAHPVVERVVSRPPNYTARQQGESYESPATNATRRCRSARSRAGVPMRATA